jgi:hypothetical protein
VRKSVGGFPRRTMPKLLRKHRILSEKWIYFSVRCCSDRLPAHGPALPDRAFPPGSRLRSRYRASDRGRARWLTAQHVEPQSAQIATRMAKLCCQGSGPDQLNERCSDALSAGPYPTHKPLIAEYQDQTHIPGCDRQPAGCDADRSWICAGGLAVRGDPAHPAELRKGFQHRCWRERMTDEAGIAERREHRSV